MDLTYVVTVQKVLHNCEEQGSEQLPYVKIEMEDNRYE